MIRAVARITARTTRSVARLLVAGAVVTAPACARPLVRLEAVRVTRRDVAVAPTPQPVVHPLTGLTEQAPQEWQTRPALAVKIENSPSARPQAGLGAADVVYEELAEGGITRLIAVFSSRDTERVGPVRSARTADPAVVASYSPLFAYSGGVPPVLAAVRSTPGIVDVGQDALPGAYYRRRDRLAPHNLYTSTAALWRGRAGGPPPSQFVFGTPGQGGPGAAVVFSLGNEETRFEFAEGAYRRVLNGAPHMLEERAQVVATNVIVQVVQVRPGTTVDAKGQVSPEMRVLGAGDAILLTGGRAYRGRWSKTSVREPTRFLDAAGRPLVLQPGRTWVELVPSDRAVAVR